jgi:wyosine [tRNA(Phe)-imidazoG37] synthetase (radical SAM superfamily)
MSAADHHSIVFGPFSSPLLGTSLGINIGPARRTKETEGSVYDQTHPDEGGPIIRMRRKMPTPGVIVTSAARRMIELSRAGDKLETLLVTGNLEPTSHPELVELIENLRELRDKWYPKAALALVSDSLDVDAAHLRHALGMFDKPVVRFEWGTAKAFASATGRPGTDLKRMVEVLAGLERLMLQATFTEGKGGNATPTELRNWIKKVGEIRPREVHLGTVAARKGGPKPLTADRLEKLAAEVTEKAGIPAQVASARAVPA